jgi:hypothetical protein
MRGNAGTARMEHTAIKSVGNALNNVSPIVFTARVGILVADAFLITTSSIMLARLSVHRAPLVTVHRTRANTAPRLARAVIL